MRTPRIALALYLLFILVAAFPAMVGGPTVRYVANGGSNTTQCTDPENPCASIHHALAWADPGDIIDIAAGQYGTGLNDSYFIQKDITFRGAGQNLTYLQAHADPQQANRRVIEIAPSGLVVVISDLTIRHGKAEGSGAAGRGGGVYNPDGAGELYLSNIDIISNTARIGGGMLNMNGGVVQLHNVRFGANQATQRGGGIYNAAGVAISLTGVLLYANAAGISGGGVYNESGVSPAIYDSIFLANEAVTGSCGGICLQPSTGTSLIVNTEFHHNKAAIRGGGMHVRNSSPALTQVEFLANVADGTGNLDGGGGMYLIDGSAPSLESVVFEGNKAGRGAGMYNNEGSAPTLLDVMFIANHADSTGGGMYNRDNSSPVLTNVSFSGNKTGDTGNQSGGSGGGMFNLDNSNPMLRNVIFEFNEAFTYGGGMHNYSSSPSLINIRFSGNSAGNGAGGMANTLTSAPVLWNVSFNGNMAGGNGGGILNGNGSGPVLYNTILWGNQATGVGNEIHNASNGSASLHYSLHAHGPSDIHDESGSGFTCSNCITDDPLFISTTAGNLRLSQGSPAIDAGDPGTPIGIFPGNPGNPIDLDGNPRFNNLIDMGAYEWLLDEIFRDRFEQ